jgi:hypothetical protein
MADEQQIAVPKRRGDDVLYAEKVTSWQALRHHMLAGSWVGNLLFLVNGVFFGFYYGGFGGMEFFSDMWLLDRTGAFADMLGAVLGIFIGLLCVWAILVIAGAACGTFVYWFRYRSFPTPQ